MKKNIFASLLCCILAMFAKAETPTSPTVNTPKFYMGVCTHFAQYKGDLKLNLKMIKDAGFNSIRDDIYWSQVEREKGKYDYPKMFLEAPSEAQKAGLVQLSVLAYGNPLYDGGAYPQTNASAEAYSNFAADVAKKLKGKNAFYQVWNEWDGGCGMPEFRGTSTPKGYAELLKKSYEKIKAADADATVVLNSICKGDKEFEELLKTGVIQNCDVLSLHTYNHSESQFNRTPEAWYKRMLGVGEIVKKYNFGKTKDLFITEMGFNNRTGRNGYTYAQSADYAARLYLLARTIPWIKGIWWYDFQDDGIDESELEDNFGLVKYDLTPKPAYYALQSISHIIKNGEFAGKFSSKNKNLYVLRFKVDENDVLAIWNSDPKNHAKITIKNKSPNRSNFTLYHAGSSPLKSGWGMVDKLSHGNFIPDSISFSATERPLILEGDFSNIEISEAEIISFDETKRPDETNLFLPEKVLIVKNPNTPPETVKIDETRDGPLPQESDLSASAQFSYTRDILKVKVFVKDNGFDFTNDIKKYRNFDHLELSFKVDDKNAPGECTTFAVAAHQSQGLKSIPVKTQFGQSAADIEGKFEISTGGYTYEIDIPAAALGLVAFEKNLSIGASITVEDFDDLKKTHTLRWGKGNTFPVEMRNFKMLYFN